MAVAYDRASDVVREQSEIAKQMQLLLLRVQNFIHINQTTNVDWGATPAPSVLVEDANGNLEGFQFSRQDVANGVFSMLQYVNLMTNQTVTQGDHLGNLDKLAAVATDI